MNDYEKMVRECLKDDSDRLTAWEIEFLDSVVLRKGDYTEKQKAVIDRIWQKLFA